jgi:NADH-quinone oxidoreductase subunit E
MSARRLAQDSVQPASFKFNRDNAKWARATINKYPKGRQASAVIPLLMRAQDQDGWVTKASIEAMADMLQMPYIRVLEVATFYTQFQLQPVGTKAHIQVCGTTPCMLRGAGELIAVCKKKINQQPFETGEDGSMSWEEVECQGACVNAPMIMVFKDTYEDLSPDRLEEIIDAFQAGDGDKVKAGPQIDRIYSAPFGGPTALTSDPNVKKSKTAARRKSTKTAAKKPVTKTNSAKTTPAKSAPKTVKTSVKAKPATAKAVAIASLEDKNRPKAIKKPKLVDDLKLISGVGPKLEGVLHSLGIYQFAQVASWKKAEREWVDGYLNFKGRIERDDWIKQAKALAKGGREEYVKVFGKEPR